MESTEKEKTLTEPHDQTTLMISNDLICRLAL